ncbi:MAG: glutamate-5-semialdehyde dehydrogenase [Peptococcaceae bacterium]|jgi:glutamate-5-semialdehyde dehydrogenase|nr:glutamate-5-semialdehyde dehydrogenase [Peptococcaceae bacterium]
MGELQQKGQLAKEASYTLAVMTTEEKNKGLLAMADALEQAMDDIMAANALDMEAAKANGKPQSFLDRLLLNEGRIKDMADGIRAVAELPDPVGHVEEMWLNKDNLQIGKIAVPLGVIGMIYEARPNVTADAAALCLKSGNAVMLRGSGDAIESNKKIAAVLSSAAERAGIPHGAIQLIEDTTRETANEMMRLNEYLDVLIPRGGAGLIQNVVKNATVPVIETGVGNCHIYVDETADLQMAVDIIMNGKVQRPGVCNATESLLVHKNIAEKLLPMAAEQLLNAGVELRGCAETMGYVAQCKTATNEDYATEFHSLILSVKVVESMDEAILHIRQYGTKHSEVIVTNDYTNARKFQQMVDAAVVYVNASSRFSDGFQFGFGAEIGISTQKLHARGPMGLKALTSYKYIVNGDGQVRK